MQKSLPLTAALFLGARNGTAIVEPVEHNRQLDPPLAACNPPEVMEDGECVRQRLPKEPWD